MKKLLILLLTITLLTSCSVKEKENNTETDAIRFSQEYNITEDNPFKYITEYDVINILENGTGVIYFGFKECPWCNRLIPVLTEAANELNINTIYYYNIKDIRDRNTNEYQKIVSLLDDYLDTDDSGNKRIYVPDVYFVKGGNIIERHYDVLDGYDDVSIPFTEEQHETLLKILKQKLANLYNLDCDC